MGDGWVLDGCSVGDEWVMGENWQRQRHLSAEGVGWVLCG